MTMHIGHAAFRVRDLQASAEFSKRTLGLRSVAESSEEILLTASGKHHELQLIAAEATALDHVGLELESEAELQATVDRAVGAGARILDSGPPEPGFARSVRILGPAGIVYELHTTMERPRLDVEGLLGPAVRRLGHLTFFAADHAEILTFWLDGLGFRVSDTADGVTWTRCDPDHHGLAIGPRPEGNYLHHHAWEVQDLGAMGRILDSWAVEGLRVEWGPVRHGPGANLASYLHSPHGDVIEIYSDMLRIQDESAYQAPDWGPVESPINVWGPAPMPSLFEMGIPIAADPTPLDAVASSAVTE
jgi:catechol-2,3-dioxygenase